MRGPIRWRAVWDAVVTLTTVVTCAYVVLTVGISKVHSPAPASVSVGAVLKPSTAISFADVDLTILIGMSSTCHFCQESLPAFRELATEMSARGAKSRTIALTLEPTDTLAAYLSANGLPGVQSVSIDTSAPLAAIAARTPQIIAVDRSGKVIEAWVGRISDDQMRGFIGQLPTQSAR